MNRELEYAVNDLLDTVEILAEIVRELNPGATAQLDRVQFLLQRADRGLREAADKR